MRSTAGFPRPLARPRLALVALALLLAPPATASASPGLTVATCDVTAALDARLGERSGGFWLDAPTQTPRIGILDRADEPQARAAVAACDAQDAARGVPAGYLRGARAQYVVVRNALRATMRAHAALVAWTQTPEGRPLFARTAGFGVGLGPGDVGLQLTLTLLVDATAEDEAAIRTVLDGLAAAHGVVIAIAEHRSAYAPSTAATPALPAPGPVAESAVVAGPRLLSPASVSRRGILARGRIGVRMRVAATTRVRVTVRSTDGRRTVLARGTAAPKRTGVVTVAAKLTRAGRARLRSGSRTPVRITVQQTGAGTTAKRVVLR